MLCPATAFPASTASSDWNNIQLRLDSALIDRRPNLTNMSRQVLRLQPPVEICADPLLVQIMLARQRLCVAGDVTTSDPLHRWKKVRRMRDSETRIRQSFQDSEEL